ncbi:MAG: hypothetical protein ABSA96_02170 [Candidatus Acidiferrales bacterium]|jgi:hypothetical protein
MGKIIIGVAACVLFGAFSLAAQDQQFFKGRICLDPNGRAPIVENGQPTLPCTVARPKRGSKYVLFNVANKTIYQLDDPAKAKAFAGVDVFVSGSLQATTATIHVTDMIPALPSKITQAKAVYIECDACPRQMAVAWSAAFQYMTEWGRFDIVLDRRKADLVFIFSANQYTGDFLTRDGPDTRGVDVKITFMDIIDPSTGQSLWSDDRYWGSLFVAQATRDLLSEFKGHLAISDSENARMLSLLDKNADGRVSKQEFLKFMEAEFDRVDTDKDGALDAEELKQLRIVDIGK